MKSKKIRFIRFPYLIIRETYELSSLYGVAMVFKTLANLLPEPEGDRPNKFTIYMGKAIRAAREEADLSQEKLAEMIYRRQATLSDMENGKVEPNAQDLWLLSAYLKKPLSYFYPEYARENMRPEEMGELEHELLMHFIAIRGKDLQKLAIDLVTVIENFDPKDLVVNLAPYVEERLRREQAVEERQGKRQQKK